TYPQSRRAASIRLPWPACKPPNVGTKPISFPALRASATAALNSSIFSTRFRLAGAKFSPRIQQLFQPPGGLLAQRPLRLGRFDGQKAQGPVRLAEGLLQPRPSDRLQVAADRLGVAPLHRSGEGPLRS